MTDTHQQASPALPTDKQLYDIAIDTGIPGSDKIVLEFARAAIALDRAQRLPAAVGESSAPVVEPVTVSVEKMVESVNGVSWWVVLRRGKDRQDDGKYGADYKNRAEWHAAGLRWILGQGPKPSIRDFIDEPAAHATSSAVAASHIEWLRDQTDHWFGQRKERRDSALKALSAATQARAAAPAGAAHAGVPLTQEQLFRLIEQSGAPYTKPVQQENRFTGEEETVYIETIGFSELKFARLIERAHGIPASGEAKSHE